MERCSFCGKTRREVRRLIAGPDVWICNECAEISAEIVAEETEDEAEDADDATGDWRCAFCGKTQDEVRKLIAGPTVYICNECIDRCNDTIGQHEETTGATSEETTGSPPAIPVPGFRVADVPPADCTAHCWHVHATAPPPTHGPHAPLGSIAIEQPPRALERICCWCGTQEPWTQWS